MPVVIIKMAKGRAVEQKKSPYQGIYKDKSPTHPG
jgi:hypothetical protein